MKVVKLEWSVPELGLKDANDYSYMVPMADSLKREALELHRQVAKARVHRNVDKIILTFHTL